jgi:beta-1,2-mannobiose phosphorylase / 1,2-beta-oligomannan phosphorylase
MPPMTSLLPRFEATIERKGVVVQPDGDANEVEGVLNPASTRALTGELLLYPRCVARGNISRIGLMKGRTRGDRVLFERLGFALEPAMAYTAFGPSGPRIVFALSADGYAWERLGLVDFAAHGLTDGDDKDAAFFPEPVHSPAGVLSLAFYHRPMRRISTADGHAAIPTLLDLPANERECTRIAYVPLAAVQDDVRNLLRPAESRIVLAPDGPWGRLKTGGGTPPVRIAEGWLSFFHAVDALEVDGRFAMTYSAGIVVHDGDEPHLLRYRSPQPVLAPSTADELHGIVSNVVFPTGIDVRGERSFDVYYGMADAKIGRASVELAAVPYASGSAIASRNSEPSAPASARNAS